MSPRVRAGLLALGACLLLFRLNSPALWQDESETALRAVSIQKTGLPRTHLDGTLVTAQPSLAAHEGTRSGIWTWNTWLPAYAAAASMAVLGRGPFAARLPFALAAWLALFLLTRLFEGEEDEAAGLASLASLALCPAYLLFGRQSRYYALTALGCVLALWAWRRLLADKPRAVLALVAALQFLLHASFASFAIAVLALGLDAALRGRECLKRRFLEAAAWTAALALPACLYFRIWDRPGNHLYGTAEGLEFLKTFLLWIALFAVPPLLPAAAAAKSRKWPALALGFAVLCGLAAEGGISRAAAALALAWLGWSAVRARALERQCLLWLGASLALLSTSAAEPYGRYLMGAMPALAVLSGLWCSRLANGRALPAAGLAAALCAVNWAGWLPLRAASAVAAPSSPAETVSGMMRRRIRDAGPRSDLARFAGELARGPEGYIDAAARAIRARGGDGVVRRRQPVADVRGRREAHL
ncbi:MAG: glycosyltransferase family 39 protein [Elusimicrobiota bacterium]|nr:MAG: glycosyltransferase family 39 protein [Elusimicrobiota bacterium]